MLRGTVLYSSLACALLLPAATDQSRAARLDSADSERFERVDRHLRDIEPDLVALRRDLHQHPEISGTEERTAGVVARRLRALGLEVRTGVGGHGVVGILRGGRPGPRVALRADMDAVRSDDPDPVAFRSTVPGIRHICGHDVHVAIALGVADALADQRKTLPGTIVFVFQPAEERATGAHAMLADSVFRDGLPNAIFALHTSPLEVGTLGGRPGVLLAGRDRFTIVLEGKEGVVSESVRTIEGIIGGLDTVDRAARFVPQPEPFRIVQGLRSTSDPGGARWTIEGQLAVTNDSLRDDAERRLGEAVAGLAPAGVHGSVDYRRRELAGVHNDPELEARAHGVVRDLLGDAGYVPITRVIPAFSEDFGSFQDVVPGVMLWLGVANAKKGLSGMPHSPDYVADEDAILVGTRAMSRIVLDALLAR